MRVAHRDEPLPSTATKRTRRLSPRLQVLVVVLCGGLLTLAFPEPSAAPLAWVALVPLLLFGTGATASRGALLGAAFGIGFFATLLVWITHVGYMGWIVLVLVQAFYVVVFGASWAIASRRRSGLWRVVVAASLWTACEYLRSRFPVGGFTWGELSQSQASLGWLLRPAAIGGGWLVTWLVVAVNAALAEAVGALPRSRAKGAAFAAAAVGLVGIPLVMPVDSATGPSLEVAIVQGNVPRDFAGSFFEKNLAILDSHVRLTEELQGRPDLVVWPESSVGGDPSSEPLFAQGIEAGAHAAGAPMIVGGERDVDAERRRVVAFEVGPEGDINDTYVKTHLVPFGEYVPARDLLGWIPALDQVPRDAVPGNEHEVFDVAGTRVAPVISFEGDFGSLVRRSIDSGGRVLVVATNTSTWGHSWASAQHVAFSRVRAVENGVWVVHAALSGISAFVAPDGAVVDSTPLWTATTMTHTVRAARDNDVTLYARAGDWVPFACLVVSVVALLLGIRATQRRGVSTSP